MVPENIVWAFFSPFHYQMMVEETIGSNAPTPNDIYYQDTTGKWVKVTAIFECIEKARRTYRHNDLKYLGGVLANTKTEVPHGSVFPPPVKPPVELEPRAISGLKKKKRLSKSGTPGTLTVKKEISSLDLEKLSKYFYKSNFDEYYSTLYRPTFEDDI